MSRLSAASHAVELLRKHGVEVDIPTVHSINIGGINVPRFSRAAVPSASEIHHDQAFYTMPRLSPSLRLVAARTPGITIVALATGEIWFRGEQLAEPVKDPWGSRTPQRFNYVLFGLLRALARTSQPRRQLALADELGTTQASISQNMKTISHLLERSSKGYRAKAFDLVADEFLSRYPGPGGFQQGWVSESAVVPQGLMVKRSHPQTLLSADSAADQLAPHRMPRTAMVYSLTELNLEELGFTRVTKDQATLITIIPADRTIFPLSAVEDSGLADGLLVVYDLMRSAGTDAEDAALELLAELRGSW